MSAGAQSPEEDVGPLELELPTAITQIWILCESSICS